MRAFLLSFLVLTGVAQAGTLTVIQSSPQGDMDSLESAYEVTATFSQPMVALSDNASMGNFCPIKLSPALPGRCRWRDTHTLVYEITPGSLKPGQEIKASIAAGTASQISGDKLGETFSWSFTTLRPRLTASAPRDREQWLGLNPHLYLAFNLTVSAQTAGRYLVLEENPLSAEPLAQNDDQDEGNSGGSAADDGAKPKGPAVGVTVESLTRKQFQDLRKDGALEANYYLYPSVDQILRITPATALKPNRHYRLWVLKGLPAEGGGLGSSRNRIINFETQYDLAWMGHPDPEPCVGLPARKHHGAASTGLTFNFSNPVDADSFLKHLSISPVPAGWAKVLKTAPDTETEDASDGEDEDGGGHDRRLYEDRIREKRMVKHSIAGLFLKLGTTYQFTLKAGLKDAFGNSLAKDESFSYSVGSYCKQVKMTEGFAVLESYLAPRHPVDVVNPDNTPMKIWNYPLDQAVPAYQEMEEHRRLPDSLKPSIERNFAVSVTRNVALNSYVDLAPALKGGKGGLIGLQMPSDFCDSGDCHQWALDNLTTLGLTFKTAPDSTLIWVTRLRSGEPAAGIPVQLRLASNKVVWMGITGQDGVALAPGWRALGIKTWDEENGGRPKLYALAVHPDGTAIIGSQLNGGIEPWRFNLSMEWKPQEAAHRGLIFSDRDVYKPGETVQFKGVLRSLDVDDWTGSQVKSLDLELQNSRGDKVFQKTVALSAQSSFDLSFEIPADAPTGEWTLTAQSKRHRVYLDREFRVEAFKPAAFEVKLSPARSEIIQGEALNTGIEGWYLFGAPMAAAPAEYNLLLEPTSFAPAGWDEFDFSPPTKDNDTRRRPRSGGSGALTLDAQGRSKVESPTQGVDIAGPYRARFEVGVTSPDRQRLFGRAAVLVHPSSLYVGVKQETRVAEAGKNLNFSVIVAGLDGKALPGVAISGKLRRREYLSVRTTGMAGRLEWRHESRDVDLEPFTLKSGEAAVPYSVKADKPGEYYVTLSIKDAAGRENSCASQVYVAGAGQAWWGQEDQDMIQLVSDKNEYHPGDEARVLVQSPWTEATALVTVERETVMERFVVQLHGGADFVKIPIQEKYLPNVFVGVTVVKGRGAKMQYDNDGLDLAKPQAKFGYLSLAVHPEGRRLSVALGTDKNDYRPGANVKVNLHVRNAAGTGEAAEVTLYAVDEGVLQLTGYQTPDLFQAFYGPRPLYVLTADSRVAVLGQRSFGEKGQSRGGGGGGPALEGIDLRSNFKFLASWTASLKTDANGDAKAQFKLPDNLSSFRVMAVVHTGKRFGKADTRIRVNKPLMLRPSLPRFARLGDKFKGGVVIHNDSKTDTQVTLELLGQGEALAVSGAARRTVAVKAGSAVEALWDLSAPALGKATLAFRAAASMDGPETDGLEWPLPVILPEKLETVATSGISEGEAKEGLRLPSGARLDNAKLRASLSSSALSGLKDGVAYLLDYPHGCLEQRLSRSVPVVAGADLLEAFHLGELSSQKKAVQDVLAHLPDFQHGSGGYCYWPGCPYENPSPYLTAYALELASMAKDGGYSLPQASIDRGLAYLKGVFEKQQDWGYPYSEAEVFAVRAYALDVLSLYHEAPSGYLDQLYQHRDQLPFQAKAHLLKAAQRLSPGGPQAKTLAHDLLNQAKLSPRTMHFEEPAGTRMPWVHESTVQSTAVCLEALLSAQGGFAGDDKAVAWLTAERKDKGVWRSTQENAWGLRAFQAFYKRYEAKAPEFDAQLLLQGPRGDNLLWKESFEGRSLETKLKDFDLAPLFNDGSQSRLEIVRKGEGRLYYGLAMDYLPASFAQPASEGFEIQRVVKELGSQSPAAQPYKAGKKYAVTLTVKTRQDRTFVAVTDALPGGFEVIDSSFATESQHEAGQLAKSAAPGSDWDSFTHAETYDDRVQVYGNFLKAGVHTWTYLVQASTPGIYSVPATWVEQMYEPEVFGRTASSQAEVR